MPTPQELKDIQKSITPQSEQKKRDSRLLIGVAIVIVILLVVMSVVSFFTPRKTAIRETQFMTRNMDNTTTRLATVHFTGEAPSIPAELNIAQATSSLSTNEVITALISQYGLQKADPNTELWTNGPYYLSKDPYSETYLFATSLVSTTDTGQAEHIPSVQKDSAVKAASQFVQQLLPNVQLKPFEGAIESINLGQESETAEPDKATALMIPFAPTINDIPIFYKKQTDYPFFVTIDGKNEVRKIVFLPQFQTYRAVAKTPSISVEKAINQILAGKASIINATYQTEPLSLSNLRDAELTSVSLEYRDDSEQGVVYPFFHFTGTATSTTGLAAQIEIITPAVGVDFNSRS